MVWCCVVWCGVMWCGTLNSNKDMFRIVTFACRGAVCHTSSRSNNVGHEAQIATTRTGNKCYRTAGPKKIKLITQTYTQQTIKHMPSTVLCVVPQYDHATRLLISLNLRYFF